MRELGGGWVEGEVSEPRVAARGNMYFTLGDRDASLKCMIYEDARLGNEQWVRAGQVVRARFTQISFYARSWSLTLLVDQVRPVGEGEILREMSESLERLTRDGLTDPSRKRPLPRHPRRIGVIAGRDSDALADVVGAIRDRFPPSRVVVCHAQVEGLGAADSVIDALARMIDVPGLDVLVIARGGGSVEALRPFSDERLCRAIAAVGVPVVTAIGHTKQRPNCDAVSDAAAPVPRAVAELIVPSAAELRSVVALAADRIEATCRAALAAATERVGRAGTADTRLAARLSDARLRLDFARSGLREAPGRAADQSLRRLAEVLAAQRRRLLEACANRLDLALRVLATGCPRQCDRSAARLADLAHRLREGDPMIRGGAVIVGPDGHPITEAAALAPGDGVTIRFADGSAEARITSARAGDPGEPGTEQA